MPITVSSNITLNNAVITLNSVQSQGGGSFTTVGLYSTFTTGATNNTAATSKTISASLTGVPANALIAITFSWDAFAPQNASGSFTSNPALTWTLRTHSIGSNVGNTECWTAIYPAGGNIVISGTASATLNNITSSAMAGAIFTNADPLGATACTTSAQAAPNVPITTTAVNSWVIGCVADWNSSNAAPQVYRRTVTELLHYTTFSATDYIGYHFIDSGTSSIATYNEGMTQPNNQAAGMSLLEIKVLS